MHLWETINGEQFYDTIEWTPFVFVPVKVETGIKSIFGDQVAKKTFATYRDYKNYQASHMDIFENDVNPVIQFLTERYNGLEEPTMPDIHIGYLDIEAPHKYGFPNVEETPASVVLISIVDEKKNRTVFGIGDYTRNPENVPFENIEYINCNDEGDLLHKFFNWMQREKFDVLTGWNIVPDSKMNEYGGFDIPYLIRRTIKLYGAKTALYKKLSPINKVKIFKSKKIDGVYNVGIAGVSVIDFMALYKWFSTNNMESFKLDYVAETELKKNKLDYSEYNSLWDMYDKDWNKFTDYCIIDSEIVADLEDKLGYIKLAQTLSSYCFTQMTNYNSSVPLIEGLFLKYFRLNGLCAPYLHGGGDTDHFPAAYVKPPQVGIHDDVIDIDITSSYPSMIITQNMSNETYFGRIIGFNKDHITEFKSDMGIHEELHYGRPMYQMVVDCVRKGEFPPFHILCDRGIVHYSGKKLDKFNMVVKRKLVSISPNGAVFMNQPKGIMATVEKKTFLERKKQKGLKMKYKKMAMDEPDKKDYWMEKSNNKHALQWALKVLVNSLFGICSVPYSRWGNIHVAEAITSSGRWAIQSSERFVDDLLNDPTDDLIKIVDEIKSLVV